MLGAKSAAQVWTAAAQALRLQLPRSTWATWLADVRAGAVLRDAAGVPTGLELIAPTQAAQEWLTLRLSAKLTATLTAVVGQPMTVMVRL